MDLQKTADWYDSYSLFSLIPMPNGAGELTWTKMYRKFAHLTLNELLENLSDCTLQYSHMHMAGGREQDFYRVKKDILDLQQEIVRRKEMQDTDRNLPSDRKSSN